MSVRPTLRTAAKRTLRYSCAVAGRAQRGRRPPPTTPRVLCYHGVCETPPDEWSVTPAQLRAHIALVREHYVPVTIDDVVAWHLGEIDLPERAVAVTFDDGYLDVLEHAAPILDDAGVPGAVFIVSDLAGGGEPAAGYVVTRPVMRWHHVAQLAAGGWTIGSHSVDHPCLARMTDAEVRRQFVDSRDVIEQLLGRSVSMLAYPYGTASTVSPRDHAVAAAVGYRAAFMDTTGVLDRSSPTWALPRSKVLGIDGSRVVNSSFNGDLDLWRFVESRSPAA